MDRTKFLRYTAQVPTLMNAWAFVMGVVEEFPKPSITIEAAMSSSDGVDWHEQFVVSVYGTVEGEGT